MANNRNKNVNAADTGKRRITKPGSGQNGSRKVTYSGDQTDRSSSIFRRGSAQDFGGAVGHEGNNAIPYDSSRATRARVSGKTPSKVLNTKKAGKKK